MITEVLNNNLIEAMRIRIPDGTNLANVLMDILYIGKEAVYRRLRGGSCPSHWPKWQLYQKAWVFH